MDFFLVMLVLSEAKHASDQELGGCLGVSKLLRLDDRQSCLKHLSTVLLKRLHWHVLLDDCRAKTAQTISQVFFALLVGQRLLDHG